MLGPKGPPRFLQKHEEEILQRNTYKEKNRKLEGVIDEKDAKMQDLVQRVNEVEKLVRKLLFLKKVLILIIYMMKRLKHLKGKSMSLTKED